MRTTPITELKATLSETLAKVKAGEEILVTEHGRPIARIVPLPAYNPEEGMEELIRAGLVKPPEKEIDEEFWRLPRGEDPEGLVLSALLEDRRFGR